MTKTYKSKVAGVGSYLPEKLLTNADLEKIVDTTDQWVTERTGIRSRHVASPEEVTSDLCYKATLKALEAANLTPKDLDFIIVATSSPDQVMPSTACVLQTKLGISGVPGFDLAAACSGFVYAISVADQFIKTGAFKNILVIGAEIITRLVNYKDRDTCILFGDGAGAFIISRTDQESEQGILSTHLHAYGEYGDLFVLPAGGSKIPFSQEALDKDLQYVTMKGREIFRHAVRTLTECCKEALDSNNIKSEQVDWVVPHQANIRILHSVAEYFGIPQSKLIVSLHETGNTSAASVPVAFDMAITNGQIKRGQIILIAAFGAGLTSGSILLRY
jgi:3-oxoacyl-[acyl-carrier-protein] synthase-3